MRYAVPRLLAALFLAGAGLGPVAGPADAAVCSSDTGVTVVVDFHELGGGVQTVCDPGGGGKTAADLFPANGFPLDYVQRQPGFVCRVSGKPADDPCVNTPPADAYWGLFWSNGTNGQWSYASSGAGSLSIPDGGSVAFSWQGSTNRAYPGVAPPEHASQPSSSPSSQPAQPSSSPSSKPSGGGGATGGGGTGSSTGSATGSATGVATASPTGAAPGRHDRKSPNDQKPAHRKHHKGEQSTTPSPTAESSSAQPMAEGATPTSGVVEPDSSGGMPGWIPLAAIGLLFATAVGVGVVQRRRS